MYRQSLKSAARSAPVSTRLGAVRSRLQFKVQQRRDLHQTDKADHSQTGYLVLEDGSIFRGQSFGAKRAVSGEAVFNTGMVGYPESLTDPSYRGQILSFTYPSIGNYGVPPHTMDELGLHQFFESDRIHTTGVIVANYSPHFSHWNAAQSLSDWLKAENIPALTGIDTRQLTKKLRSQGTMLAKIIFEDDIPFDNPNVRNLVDEVSTKSPKTYGPKDGLRVAAIDCGIKSNCIRALVRKGCQVTVLPWDYNFLPELESGVYDGLFISNGPGDPEMLETTVQNVRKAYDLGKPIFGICMGNHVMARAAGASTFKLRYGNRGQNQPVVDTQTNKAYITPQNHGFAVDTSTLRPPWKQSFYNANDFSNEGIYCENRPFYSVQFHPEARGGPYDTDFLFDKFVLNMHEAKNKSAKKIHNMPQRKEVKKVLILGSGGLQIGQAGEFDYSGSQAIKALKEEGIQTVLMNPNIATVQTAKGLADRVYFLPVNSEFVEEVIKKERPDGVLLSFGGQTALNVGLEMYQKGIFQKHGVNVLGTPVEAIEATEDRDIFKQKLLEIGEHVAPSIAANTLQEAIKAANEVGYPVILRAAFSLGGLGSGFADNDAQLTEIAEKAFAVAPQVLVEKSIKGWKEVEYEVVRDQFNNCVTVCNMENFDPMGIHTGESIVIAPSQTLSNEEYHKLRLAAIRIIQHVGIIGECNVQYALNPTSEQYCVIEVNPRLSRSSALASKATGYPLAAVAAKLALGLELPKITNSITKTTTACFEPSLDYMVVKMPRWDMAKFRHVIPQLGSAMKSVGEVMSIGRNFEEALQKAVRMVDGSNKGFQPKPGQYPKSDAKALDDELTRPTPQRIFALAEALERGYSVDKLHSMTKIDQWWLTKLTNIHNLRKELNGKKHLTDISRDLMYSLKLAGFSDLQISAATKEDELKVRSYRKELGVIPVMKQIDTLAAEFPAKTNYLYVTYGGKENDVLPDPGAVLVLGSGTYRIGSSVEFDYGAVHTIRALRAMGRKTIMLNYNPETVSTDYDEPDRLYFEELSRERVLDIYEYEKAGGVVVSMGGQQPQNLTVPLFKAGVNILGTHPDKIDTAEDRYRFSKLLDELKIDQPAWKELSSMADAKKFAKTVSYPVLVRPSYVLSGAAMKVAYNDEQLEEFLGKAADVSPDHPVVMTKFYENAQEIEIDAVAQKGKVVNWAVSQHVEYAGVHSGDATLVFPAVDLPAATQQRIRDIGAKIARGLDINGPFNMQFLEKDGWIGVIECNLRSSRSFPFVSKCLNVNFIENATKIFVGENVEVDEKCGRKLKHVSVKAPQFSFARLPGADPVLGVEMASTGEVACYGENKYEAYLKSVVSAGFRMPKKTILISGDVTASFAPTLQQMVKNGYELFHTPEASAGIQAAKVQSKALSLGTDADKDSAFSAFKAKSIHLTINFPYKQGADEKLSEQMRLLRRQAVNFAIPIITNQNLAEMTIASMEKAGKSMLIKGWDEYFPEEADPFAGAAPKPTAKTSYMGSVDATNIAKSRKS